MDRHRIASGLLRDLWRIYDAGGHSLRSMRSQLLETDWAYGNSLLEGEHRTDFNEFLESEDVYESIPEQYLLFSDPLYLTDLEARYLVLTGLMRYYESVIDASYVEANMVYQAAHYAGLPADSTQFRAITERMDMEKIITHLRFRAWVPDREY